MKDALRNSDLFSELSDAEFERVARGMRRHDFAAGERIIEEHRPADRCYMILSGSVRVSASVSGGEDFYAILNPGDHFGEISLIDGQAPSASVVAEEPTEAASISHEDLRRFLADDPAVAAKILMAMMKALCRRLRETDQSLAFTRFMMRQGRP